METTAPKRPFSGPLLLVAAIVAAPAVAGRLREVDLGDLRTQAIKALVGNRTVIANCEFYGPVDMKSRHDGCAVIVGNKFNLGPGLNLRGHS